MNFLGLSAKSVVICANSPESKELTIWALGFAWGVVRRGVVKV